MINFGIYGRNITNILFVSFILYSLISLSTLKPLDLILDGNFIKEIIIIQFEYSTHYVHE